METLLVQLLDIATVCPIIGSLLNHTERQLIPRKPGLKTKGRPQNKYKQILVVAYCGSGEGGGDRFNRFSPWYKTEVCVPGADESRMSEMM